MDLITAINLAIFIGAIWILFMILAPIFIVTGIINIVKLSKKVKAKK